MKVSAIFKKPLSDWYSAKLTIGDFISEAEVEINMLHPTQEQVEDYLVLQKIADNCMHSEILVAIVNSMYILVNGHHTVAANLLNGRQTVKAKIYKHPPR